MESYPPLPFPARLRAALRLRCPRCGQGPVFRGWFTMNHFCLECGYVFVREAGFFLGAMYFSYALGTVLLALFTTILALFVVPDWPLWQVLGPAFLLLVPFAPAILRYSRVFWFHFEQWVNPV
jgi:uncharacterized protein (DUF983 family)